MLKMFTLAILIVTALSAGASGAWAQNYPWCALYSGGGRGGAENCGFVSFDQCMDTLRGIGGFCNINTQYVPPAGTHYPTYRSSRHIKHKIS